MTQRSDPRLRRLVDLVGLLHQDRLARLAEEAAACEAARHALLALEPRQIDPSDPTLISAQLRHQKWASHCRQNVQADMERRRERLAHLRREAALSLARCRVIDEITRRTKPDHPS